MQHSAAALFDVGMAGGCLVTGTERAALKKLVDQKARGRREAAQVMRNVIAKRAPRIAGHCIYCGAHCQGRACRAHRDLIQLELALVA